MFRIVKRVFDNYMKVKVVYLVHVTSNSNYLKINLFYFHPIQSIIPPVVKKNQIV